MKRLLPFLLITSLLLLPALPVAAQPADNAYQALPFAQNWTNTALITADDTWTGVPGVLGYRGDDLTTATGTDPQTILADGAATPLDVNANQTTPNSFTSGGVAEFELADPTIALNGSGTADAPFLLLHLNTTGLTAIQVSYVLRDLDGSADNAAQQVALHFRAGATGDFTNVPAGYVADATSGPNLATLVTPVSVTLPPAANNQPQLQVRIMTTNAAGNDEWVGVDAISVTATSGPDTPPTVTSTTPADGATNVPPAANITLAFSEAVDATADAVRLECPDGTHVAFAGLPANDTATITLDPTAALPENTTCVARVRANEVTDNDGAADQMAADVNFSFTTGVQAPACGAVDTPIGLIQGPGPAFDPAHGGTQTVQGVVVGDYEGPTPALRGFYVQDLPASDDDNPLTSDAIFVFEGDGGDRVSLGQVVQVTGSVAEFQDQTQLASTAVEACGEGSVAPTDVTLPVPSATYLEQFEGMLVRFPQTLFVTEHFQLGRFGQVVLSANARLQQPTAVALPGAPALALQAANNLNRIILDDALNSQNPDPIVFGRGGNPLSATNTLRGGDTATGIVGVLTYTWAGNAASGNAYRLRPLNALGGGPPNFQPANPRPVTAPLAGGTLRVAGMNLLNFFNTFDGLPDTVDNCTTGVGGAPTDCRGADTQAELDRQWPKTVAAIVATGADVIAFSEIENDGYGPDSAIQYLVTRLNAATAPGTYAFIDADAGAGQVNALGEDAIKVGLLYKPAQVTPVGTTAALNSVAFVNGGDSAARSRPALAQAFEQAGERFVVVANHLKSKGSACDAPDAGDGQGNCNAVRTNAAAELLAWLASDPTGTGEPDVLIMGDLNSYAMEDPVAALIAGGYTNLVRRYGGPGAYGYVFDGQWGYLDHALASWSLAGQVRGLADYHINADEPAVLDYNMDFKSAGQIGSLYAPGEFRMSDHDPVLVSLQLGEWRLLLPVIAR